ncbi:MAG TPA: hypothetical protein VHV83_01875 [Armatimonadota bacterium]|nr:hypothetical protein [Armatimonadota bacterium]
MDSQHAFTLNVTPNMLTNPTAEDVIDTTAVQVTIFSSVSLLCKKSLLLYNMYGGSVQAHAAILVNGHLVGTSFDTDTWSLPLALETYDGKAHGKKRG